jgi:hypothetical protein
MRRVVLAVAIAVLAAQTPAWSAGASDGAAQRNAAKRYHLAVSGMT